MSGKPAARVTDPTDGANPIVEGSGDVFFDGLPAARQGEATECGGVMSDGLATTVFINGKPAATVDSVGTHGNKVTAGSGTVIIGNSHTPVPFVPPVPMPGYFNNFFVLRDEEGKPITNYGYRLETESGEVYEGVTDANGHTKTVSTGKTSQILKVSLLSPAGVANV
ncbi:PAAR domain-containing protein [Pseudomonas sp. EA_65y_Pfl1_P120]|uniref:PAAR domain-containing protein n=1 Tax=Pseudomonas sp. EA_65y_Pfl1_P120 TaxID=3088693 RepID=UPI0030DD5E68